MFVDASALVAILAGEGDGRDLARRLDAAERRISSPIALFEAALAITRTHRRGVVDADLKIREFARRAGIVVEPIGAAVGVLALAAHERYGKGSGHPAQLSLGDCFAYAMARHHGVGLLYKGDEFARTDLA